METDETAKSDSSDGASDGGQRRLPSLNVTEQNIDESYAQFILYCNPSIPLTVDTTELKRGFQSPPRTDGKMFETFKLLGLIRRLDSQELETWAALVLELGVEPPDPAKEQSTQKVQQFAVRLKVISLFFEHVWRLGACDMEDTEDEQVLASWSLGQGTMTFRSDHDVLEGTTGRFDSCCLHCGSKPKAILCPDDSASPDA